MQLAIKRIYSHADSDACSDATFASNASKRKCELQLICARIYVYCIPRNGSRSLSITGKMDAQVEEELELAVLLARMLTRMLAYRLKSIRVDSKQAPLQDIEWIRAIAGFIGQIHMCANNISFPVSLFENKQHIVTRAQDQGVGYRYLALLGLPRRGSGSFSSQSSSG